jgi:hypothetical protein
MWISARDALVPMIRDGAVRDMAEREAAEILA